jgi:hypothetical protein
MREFILCTKQRGLGATVVCDRPWNSKLYLIISRLGIAAVLFGSVSAWDVFALN